MNLRLYIIAGLVAVGGLVFYLNGSNEQTVADGAVLADVIVPELSGDAVVGETAFNANCTSCHGKNAAGKNGLAPPLVHKIYEPSHHSDMSFVLAVKNGVRAHHWRFGNMPPVEGVKDDDIEKIITYVRTLQRANGIN